MFRYYNFFLSKFQSILLQEKQDLVNFAIYSLVSCLEPFVCEVFTPFTFLPEVVVLGKFLVC